MSIQDPYLISHLKEARERANDLLDEKGRVDKIFPKELKKLIERFKVPVANRTIEKLILYSIDLPLHTKVGDRELRWAVLSALLMPLRQNIGSCFATAPAILIQKEQPERLLLDLYDLVMTCSLARTFSGVENRVPISPSWGFGELKKPIYLANYLFEEPGFKAVFDVLGLSSKEAAQLLPHTHVMTVEKCIDHIVETHFSAYLEEKKALAKNAFKATSDHALLKTWEYTLASFTDYKVEFYRWNLYTSLGLDPKKPGGIGDLLYQTLEQKLSDANQEIEKKHQDYLRAGDEVRVTQALLRQASSRDRFRQLKTELEVRSHHLHGTQDILEKAQSKAQSLSTFFNFLIEQYTSKFQEYFQEIYDPEMLEVETDLYDDAPAGFRLIYKHGRRDPSAWTFIYQSKDYISSLVQFFRATEPMMLSECKTEDEKKLLEELTTLLIHHLQTDLFLTSAIERMGKAHKTSNSERHQKKPWSYTSGGTLHTLLRCYYCLDKELAEEKKRIETPMDLLIFLLDLMKELPYRITRPFETDAERGLLMYSPTHAFVFRPGLYPFKQGWLDRGFSYTWARDHALFPSQAFYDPIRLDEDTQRFLAQKLPIENFTPSSYNLSLPEFRQHLFESLKSQVSSEVILSDHLDGFLRGAFPLLRTPDLEKLAEWIPEKKQADFLAERSILSTSKEVFHRLSQFVSIQDAREIMTKVKFLPPQPILFADTNWSRFFFGIGYNPGLGALDLWRFDPHLQEGYPLSVWRSYLDGSDPSIWGVLTEPKEYRGEHLPDFALLRKV